MSSPKQCFIYSNVDASGKEFTFDVRRSVSKAQFEPTLIKLNGEEAVMYESENTGTFKHPHVRECFAVVPFSFDKR